MKYLIIALILLTSCTITPELTILTENKPVQFTIELAKTSEQQEKGLMFRETMPKDHGMLFIFEDNGQKTFWMKNTLIPLDIIFIDEKFFITGIQNAKPCKQEPCTIYNGTGKYVLEINAGQTEQNNIKIRDKVVLTV